MENLTIETLGFVILPDGKIERFQERQPGQLVLENFHYENAQRIIKKYHHNKLKKYENSEDIDTLAILMSIIGDIVFLNTTKFTNINKGVMYLPLEESEKQIEQLKLMKSYLEQFQMECGKFQIVDSFPECIQYWDSAQKYLETLKEPTQRK